MIVQVDPPDGSVKIILFKNYLYRSNNDARLHGIINRYLIIYRKLVKLGVCR
jgi:hypothetical protein